MGKSQERFGFAPNPSVSGDSKLRGRTARNFCGPMEEMAKPRTAKTGMCVCCGACCRARQYGAQQVSSMDSCVRGVSTTTRGRGREARGGKEVRGGGRKWGEGRGQENGKEGGGEGRWRVRGERNLVCRKEQQWQGVTCPSCDCILGLRTSQ